MNKKLKIVTSILITLILSIVLLTWLEENTTLSSDHQTTAGVLIMCFLSGGLQVYNESKKSRPEFGNIAMAAILSFIGLGIALYELMNHKAD